MIINVLLISICAYSIGNMYGKHIAASVIMRELEKAAKDGKTIQEFIDEVKSADESEAKDGK